MAFSFQPKVQGYSAPPLNEFAQLGQALNQEYEKGLAQWDELDLISSQIKTLGSSQDIADAAINDTRKVLNEISQSGRYEDARPYIKQAVRNLRNNKNLNQAMANYQAAQQIASETAEARKKGESFIHFTNYQQEQRDEQGNLMPLQSDYELDLSSSYRETQEKFFDNLQADSQAYSSSGIREADGLIYNVGSGSSVQALTPEKVEQYARANFSQYLQTPQAQQQLKVLTRLRGVAPEQALEFLQQEFINTGKERVFNKTERNTSSSLVGGASQLKGTKEEEPSQQMFLIDKNELVDESATTRVPGGMFTNTGIQDAWKYAFAGEEENKVKGKFELNNLLDALSQSKSSENRQFATRYRDVISKAQSLLGDNADDYLQAVFGGDSSILTGAIARSNASISQISALNKEAKKLKNQSTGLIFDSSFEDEAEEILAKKIALNVGWMTPNFADPKAFTAAQRSAWNAASTNYSLDNFDIIRGADKDLKKIKNRNVTVKRISNGPIGNGKGVGFIIEDSEGEEHIAVPKKNVYGNSVVASFAGAIGANDLVVKDKFAYGVQPGQTKPIAQVFKDNNLQFSENNGNLKIKSTENKETGQVSYQLLENDRPMTLNDKITNSGINKQTLESNPKLRYEIAQEAINLGIVSSQDIVVGKDRRGHIIDTDRLIKAIRSSNAPAQFQSQYDIYKIFE